MCFDSLLLPHFPKKKKKGTKRVEGAKGRIAAKEAIGDLLEKTLAMWRLYERQKIGKWDVIPLAWTEFYPWLNMLMIIVWYEYELLVVKIDWHKWLPWWYFLFMQMCVFNRPCYQEWVLRATLSLIYTFGCDAIELNSLRMAF